MSNSNGYMLRMVGLIISIAFACIGAVAYTHTTFVSNSTYDRDQSRVEKAIENMHEDIMHLLRDRHDSHD